MVLVVFVAFVGQDPVAHPTGWFWIPRLSSLTHHPRPLGNPRSVQALKYQAHPMGAAPTMNLVIPTLLGRRDLMRFA